jgi:hypothetical protein
MMRWKMVPYQATAGSWYTEPEVFMRHRWFM